MLLVARFTVTEPDQFVTRAHRALDLLRAQPGCRRALLTRSTETATTWLLTAEFDSVAAYRRSLSPFDVRTEVIPFLAEADPTESGAFEVVLESTPDGLTHHQSLLAADADSVRLGEASGPTTAR